jgi:hypothetical protein
MKFLKTGFSRVHAAAAAAAACTLALGAALRYGVLAYEPFGAIHGVAGASVFGLFLLLPLLSRKRASLYRALKAKLFLSRRDFRQKNVLAVAAKITALLMALTFLFQLITGALIATGLAYRLFPTFAMISFHTSFLWALLALALIHTALMLLTGRVRNRR